VRENLPAKGDHKSLSAERVEIRRNRAEPGNELRFGGRHGRRSVIVFVVRKSDFSQLAG
jgi:hypothetical protein